VKDSSSATERVGRYQLLEPIGGGPNGMVSRAKVFGVAGFERQFAVKRFAPELTTGAVAQSLSAAARSYGSLEHPRIARMSEFGVAQGQTFTAVEYVAGLDAFRLLQEAKLAGVAIAAGGALALVSQAARAVGYAHGRGLSHLGLCPTNVIVTVDGDVKVTDFGILAATMPPLPVETPRLAHRIPYLAPEQLAGESTSAATDVFVLGVIAYELVTGQRAYRGDTPAAVAQAILAGPPAEPPLPRPIVRVLQRCLARSPFERFPDARALADALDAALRVAPVPGTRKDIGAQIKTTLDRYAALNEGNLSGMVALPPAATAGQTLDPHDVSTQQFSRPDTAKTDVSPVVPNAGATMRELPKPFSTVAGLAPPPIPVPPGVTTPPTTPPAASPGAQKTMLGLSPVKKGQIPGVIPPIARPNGPSAKPSTPPPPRGATPPPMPAVSAPTDDDVIEPSGLLEVDDLTPPPADVPISEPPGRARIATQDSVPALPATPSTPHIPTDALSASQRLPKPTPGHSFETPTGEMSPSALTELNRRSVKATAELESLETLEKPYEIAMVPPAVDDPVDAFASEAQAAASDVAADSPRATIVGVAPAPAPTSAPAGPTTTTEAAPRPRVPAAPSRSKTPAILVTLLLLGGLGAAGWYAYTTMSKDDQPVVATNNHDAQVATTPTAGDAAVAQADTVDAALVATATLDAGTQAAAIDAGVAAWENPVDAAVVGQATTDPGDGDGDRPMPTKPTAASDKLKITSKPSGARVFIDGADQGTTPVTLPGSADRHTMVLLLPGHDLYIGEVDGRGVFDIALKSVTPSGGHAGIKVLKCKQKERYYVYVDGRPTGQTCPTERIDTVIGAHVVEVYDIVTDSRRKWDIHIKDERLSFRVRIDN
jgi:eukaryotic-like serine/threonine-protein kinase